ncbi:MAG TPA: nuclease-related domain-containing protein [Candidatus Acidoferrales bacterium]|nr:nuclease-related domain-containing protein [Candidatus Acidoferrales bacterium]
MRKINASSSYLKNQTRKNLAKATLCLMAIAGVLAGTVYGLISFLPAGFSAEIGIIVLSGLIAAVGFLIGFYYYQHKYRIYSGGWQGEKQVAKHLTNSLSDDYYLINDLYLHGGGGDIDHLVLAPNGIFVLETKNWSGNISCVGDEWYRDRGHAAGSSPSNQVKRNVTKIKSIIDSSPNLRALGIWVEGIVVITNNHATLQLKNATVTALKLPQLPNYLVARGGAKRFSGEQLEAIGKEIAKQKA